MKLLLSFLSIFLLHQSFVAQQTSGFKPLRYNEDYSYLAGDSLKSEYEKIKFIPISSDYKTYLSFGGDARFQYFYTNNEDWGETEKDKNGYLLSRYLIHTDFHAGKHFRTFLQFQSSLAHS